VTFFALNLYHGFAATDALWSCAAQRCLQRLGPEDSQFIYDTASEFCNEIATHRHGCCVLQRCIDFATAQQKRRLVDEIARHSLVLSQVGMSRGLPAEQCMFAISCSPSHMSPCCSGL
jgi:hypothetical protein